MKYQSFKSSSRGFTLVEFIIIVLIIGIISVIALPKWQSNATNLEYEARRVLNDIRYAQALSMTSDQRYRWVQLSSTTYSVLNEAGTAIILPSGSTIATLTSSTISTLSNLPNSLVAFDSQGTPYITSAYPGTALASTASINMSSGGNTRAVQITPGTGFGALQ